MKKNIERLGIKMPKRMTQEEFENRVKEYTNDTVKVIGQYINKRTKVLVECKVCGYQWTLSPSTLMPSSTSLHTFNGCVECLYETKECAYCHQPIKRLKSDLKENKSGLVYCSRECGNRHKNEQYKLIDNCSDYRRTAFENYEHKCAVCGYQEDERVLEVHHIDEDRKNNFCNNLIILCPICHKKLTLHLYTLEELLS